MNKNKTPRIAVLAVHGVADQSSRETARNAAGLLLGERLLVDYESFVEKDIFIGLRNVKLGSTIDLHKKKKLLSWPCLSESVSQAIMSSSQDQLIKSKKKLEFDKTIAPSCEQIEHESMREQIQGFAANTGDFVLDTLVLNGRRRCGQNDDIECKVDIYEAHWADLSRLKNGFFTVFFEFYLFLFFFSRIGGITIERVVAQIACHKEWWSTSKEYKASYKKWRLSQKLHWYAEVALVIAVPVTHLAILSLAVSGTPFLVHHYFPDVAAGQMGDYFGNIFLWELGVLLAILFFLPGYVFGRALMASRWAGLFFVVSGLIGLLVWLAATLEPGVRAFVFLTWLWISLPLLALLKFYDSRRPGAFLYALISFALTGFALLYFLIIDSNDVSMEAVFLQGVAATKLIINLNVIAWLVFVFGTLFSSVSNWVSVSCLPKEQRIMGKRSAWTGDLSLILPGITIMLLTFSLWQIVLKLSEKVIPATQLSLLQKLIDQNIFPYLPLGLAIMGIGIAFALWMVSPAFISEVSEGQEKNKYTAWVGEVLTNAYDKMRGTGELLRFILILAIPVAWFYKVISCWPGTSVSGDVVANCWQPGDYERNVVLVAGVVTVILLFGSKGPFQFLALGFRAGLDVALDVANWLRILPRKNNTRGAICRRYVSILRHIAVWRDPVDKQGYDGLVIVAHSQGTVITADLLRFLNYENSISAASRQDSALSRYFSDEDKLPIFLLTFGCPLRQLYGRRFPLQYQWSGERKKDGNKILGPDPEALGVEQWSNLYCSGDYVGRYLWYDDDDEHRWEITWSDEASSNNLAFTKSREKCLGVGGHTKYWGGGYPEVAIEFDRLICAAAATRNKAV